MHSRAHADVRIVYCIPTSAEDLMGMCLCLQTQNFAAEQKSFAEAHEAAKGSEAAEDGMQYDTCCLMLTIVMVQQCC